MYPSVCARLAVIVLLVEYPYVCPCKRSISSVVFCILFAAACMAPRQKGFQFWTVNEFDVLLEKLNFWVHLPSYQTGFPSLVHIVNRLIEWIHFLVPRTRVLEFYSQHSKKRHPTGVSSTRYNKIHDTNTLFRGNSIRNHLWDSKSHANLFIDLTVTVPFDELNTQENEVREWPCIKWRKGHAY